MTTITEPVINEGRRRTDLRSISTRPDSPYTASRKSLRQGSITLAKSPSSLPSPSIVVARSYFLETSLPVVQNEDALQRRKSPVDIQQFPRRHSVLATPKALAKQLEKFSFSKGKVDLQTVQEAGEAVSKVKLEDKADTLMANLEEAHSEVKPARRKSDMHCGTPQEVLRQVPFQYTHDHLRDWGHAYLGNPAMADAFVNAVSLRRPSMAVDKDNFEVKAIIEPAELTTIRARVVPQSKGRKPFLIQRQFAVEELRRSIPRIPGLAAEPDSPPTTLRRSSRARRSSTQHTTGEATRRRKSADNKSSSSKISILAKGALPIHIEYALHYLPVLAALMLSGHVRKGDTIDLPIPQPEAWRDVLTYVYTGRGGLTNAMRENIYFLAGHA